MSLFSDDDSKVMQFTPFTFEPPPIDYSQFEGVSSFPSSTQFYEESANSETFLKENVLTKGKGRQAEGYEPNIKTQKQIMYLNPPLVYDLDHWSNSNQGTGVKFHPTRSEDF